MQYNWDALFGKLKVDEVTARGYVYMSYKRQYVGFFISDLEYLLASDTKESINFTMTNFPVDWSELNFDQQKSICKYFQQKLGDIHIPNTEDKLRQAGVIE